MEKVTKQSNFIIMEILFATSNKGKIENAQKALEPYGITVKQIEMNLTESRSEDPEEIALEKAREAFEQIGQPVIVEDSGFFIDALGGFPMTHIKFSLGTLGVEKILKMLSGAATRSGQWRMTLAYAYGEDKFKTFTFVEKGVIADEVKNPVRPTMSDYWKIYIPKMIEDNELTLGEMSDDALHKWEAYYKNNNQFHMFGEWFSNMHMK
jgi:XTP/dITP diphosphohydrolase